MKPGHIQVFDGLRLTTEHMQHLQGAFHTALQDIRRILGLGKVFYGFEVVRESENKVTVTPGLAFDRAENRIVCEEPKSLDVVFQDSEKSLFVCIKYDQVQKGIVESVATLIYDSCSVLILPDRPESNDNLIIIAELYAKDGNGDFSIVLPATDDSDEKPEGDNGIEAKADETLPVQPDETSSSNGSIEDNNTEMETAESEGADPLTEAIEMDGEDEPVTASEIHLSNENAVNTAERQTTSEVERSIEYGVIDLNSAPGQKIPIDNALVEALKNNLNQESPSSFIRFAQLSSVELPTSIPPQTITFDTVLKADVGVETEETAEMPAIWNYLSTGHGEAVFEKDGLRQFGTVMFHGKTNTSMPGFQLISADITQEGIVQVQFKPYSQIPDEFAYLRCLGLNVFVQSSKKGRYMIVTSAIWKGTISENVIDTVIKHKPYVRLEANTTWKAYHTITRNEIKQEEEK